MWLLLALGIYPYLVYPLIVRLLAVVLRRHPQQAVNDYSVTVVIAAHNEEDCIGTTIENKLKQEYPETKLSVLVVSDGSDDGTEEIVKGLAENNGRVRLIKQPRQGKTAALNRAISLANSDIVVFSDANSVYEPDAIRHLVSNFADPDVGYVTGKMVYTTPDDSDSDAGSNAYMRYENALRVWETEIGSVVGVDGGIDAVRRELYLDMRHHQLPDFVLPLSIIEQGYRVVYEPRAVLRESALGKARDEFRMRVRVTTRALWALIDFLRLLNPFRFGLYSLQLLSHKWLRYLSFIPFLAGVLSAAIMIRDVALAPVVVSLAVLILGSAAIGVAFPESCSRSKFMKLSTYFVVLQVACAVALVKVLQGKRFTTWQPRVG